MTAPNDQPARPPTGFLSLAAGVAACIAGIGWVAGMVHGGALVRAWVPEEWLRITILVLLVALGAGVYLLSSALGICLLIEGFEEFCGWTAPFARRLWHAVAEFFEDLRDSDAEPADPIGGIVNIDRLPVDVAVAVRPFLRNRHVTPQELHEALAEAMRLMAARERYARQQTAAIDRHNELELARAREAWLAGLSEAERAAVQMHLDAIRTASRPR